MKLIEARKRMRYTQQEVAGILGVSTPTYINMEKDPDSVSVEDAKKLATLFRVNVNDIFFQKNL